MPRDPRAIELIDGNRDRLDQLDNYIIDTSSEAEGALVWCGSDGVAHCFPVNGRNIVFVWKTTSVELRTIFRNNLIFAGFQNMAETSIGAVADGEVERWVDAGSLVLLDARITPTGKIVSFEITDVYGERG